MPLGPFKNDLGAGSSPVLVGSLVILNQDHDIDSFLLAVDKRTGKVVWKVDRSEFPVGYATPVLWEVNGKKQVVMSGWLRVAGYDLETGKELWTVAGMARAMHMTPTVGPDGTLYVAGWTGGGDDGDRFDVPPLRRHARQVRRQQERHARAGRAPGRADQEPLPACSIATRTAISPGRSTSTCSRVFDKAQQSHRGHQAGRQGDISETHVLWEQRKSPTGGPIAACYYHGRLFLVKTGGILTSLDARTGKAIKQERLPGGGDYYSSPVGGDGKVYLLSQRGHLAVVSAAGGLETAAPGAFRRGRLMPRRHWWMAGSTCEQPGTSIVLERSPDWPFT